MKIHSGSYGKDTVESNSFVANLLKYPEISSVMIKQFPQYSMSYLTDGLGRYAKEEMIGDNKFQWAVRGRLSRPSTLTGAGTGTGAGGTTFFREFEENYLNPNDQIKFADGRIGIILNEPTPTSGGYTFPIALTGALGSGDPGVSAGALASGVTVGPAGNSFSESSHRGYQNNVFPDWYINYTTIARKSHEISGSALTDILWVEGKDGQKLWYHTAVNDMMEDFLYQREVQAWYGVTTVDANGVSTVLDPKTGKPIYAGDGVLRQISASNMDTYSGNLTEDQITSFMTQLKLQTGVKNQHWMVFTGAAGQLAFHKAMKDLVVSTGAYVYNAQVGKDVKLGGNFTSYNAVGVTITLVHNPIFDDPNLHGNDIDPGTGLPKESFRMVFTDFGTDTNGVSNVERKVKGAGKINRGMILRYIKGMVDPYGSPKDMYAATSADSFSCEVLSESGIIIRNTRSCGQLIYA